MSVKKCEAGVKWHGSYDPSVRPGRGCPQCHPWYWCQHCRIEHDGRWPNNCPSHETADAAEKEIYTKCVEAVRALAARDDMSLDEFTVIVPPSDLWRLDTLIRQNRDRGFRLSPLGRIMVGLLDAWGNAPSGCPWCGVVPAPPVSKCDCEERIKCELAGQPMHFACGWCAEHHRPRFQCLCKRSPT